VVNSPHHAACGPFLKGVARRDFDLIVAWSVDRLGRSLQDLVGLLGKLHAEGVDLYLDQQGLYTSTPAGKAMFQMLGVFAEFERPSCRNASRRAWRGPGRRERMGPASPERQRHRA
jgi:DNA invertase Pin-like site-specific DNA recombinase